MGKRYTEVEFEEIYYQTYKKLYRIAYRYVYNASKTEDILQNVYLKLLNCNKEFENDNHRLYWLIRVTINESLDELRRMKRANLVYDDDLVNNSADSSQTVSQFQVDLVRELIGRLKPKEKNIMILYYDNEMNQDEIAETLGISKATVKRYLTKGKEKIKAMMEEIVDE